MQYSVKVLKDNVIMYADESELLQLVDKDLDLRLLRMKALSSITARTKEYGIVIIKRI